MASGGPSVYGNADSVPEIRLPESYSHISTADGDKEISNNLLQVIMKKIMEKSIKISGLRGAIERLNRSDTREKVSEYLYNILESYLNIDRYKKNVNQLKKDLRDVEAVTGSVHGFAHHAIEEEMTRSNNRIYQLEESIEGIQRIQLMPLDPRGYDGNKVISEVITTFQSPTRAIQPANLRDIESIKNLFIKSAELEYLQGFTKNRTIDEIRQAYNNLTDLGPNTMEQYDIDAMRQYNNHLIKGTPLPHSSTVTARGGRRRRKASRKMRKLKRRHTRKN